MGGYELEQPVTIVLPMHNGERQLRSSVLSILELAHGTSSSFDIVVVDDGSTDETYETACELACAYPQVKVLRQPFRQGLSAALALIRNRLSVSKVVIHDGVSPIETASLKALLEAGGPRSSSTRSVNRSRQEASEADSRGSRRFASIRAVHESMEQAHQSLASFRWIHLEDPRMPRRRRTHQESPRMTAAADAAFPMLPPMGMPSTPTA